MFDGPHERLDGQRRWLGFYTRVWRKEAGSARGLIVWESGLYPDADGAEKAATSIVAHFAAQVRARMEARTAESGGPTVATNSPLALTSAPFAPSTATTSDSRSGQVVSGEIRR
jgi:hypothetical protein